MHCIYRNSFRSHTSSLETATSFDGSSLEAWLDFFESPPAMIVPVCSISSTLWRQREDYCARLIQGAWRRRGQPIQDDLFGSRLGSRSVLDAVAEEAIIRKTGARGLRAILEQAMLDLMYDLPDLLLCMNANGLDIMFRLRLKYLLSFKQSCPFYH